MSEIELPASAPKIRPALPHRPDQGYRAGFRRGARAALPNHMQYADLSRD